MTLPAGITTCTVTIGKALGSLGEDASLSGTLTLDRRLVWSATGDTLYGVPSTVTPSQSGGWLSFIVAHVDQAGFVDQSGNSITGFSYTFSGRATFADGSVEPIVKHFQVFVGQSTLDLDLLPDGPATLPVVTPNTSVYSVNGQTGVVTVSGADDAGVASQVTNGTATKAALSSAYAPKAATYASGVAYVVGQLVVSGSTLYRVTTAHTSSGAIDLSKFAAAGGAAPTAATTTFAPAGSIAATDVQGAIVEAAAEAAAYADAKDSYQRLISYYGKDASGLPNKPWKPADPVGAELWTLANFTAGGGGGSPTPAGTANTTTLSPSVTQASGNVILSTRVLIAAAVDTGGESTASGIYRMAFDITSTCTANWEIQVSPKDQGGAATITYITPAKGDEFSPQPTAHRVQFEVVASPVGTNRVRFFDVQIYIPGGGGSASGAVGITNVTLRNITQAKPYLKASWDRALPDANAGLVVHMPMGTDASGNERWVRESFGPDGGSTLVPFLSYAYPFAAMQSPRKVQSSYFSQYAVANIHINNSADVMTVYTSPTTYELRGNTHGGETGRSGTFLTDNVVHVDYGDGTWVPLGSYDGSFFNVRRVRLVTRSKLTRSDQAGSPFANIDRTYIVYGDGTIRVDKTVTFLKDQQISKWFWHMTSQSIPAANFQGRIGRGQQVLGSVDYGAKLAVPAVASATPSTSGGTIPASPTSIPWSVRVTAMNQFGETVPNQHTSLTVTTTGSTSSIAVAWGAVAGATAYGIYFGPSGTESRVAIVTGTSYTVTGSEVPTGIRLPIDNSAYTGAQAPSVVALDNTADWSAIREKLTNTVYSLSLDRNQVVAMGNGITGIQALVAAIPNSITKNYWALEFSTPAPTILNGATFTGTQWFFFYQASDQVNFEREQTFRAASVADLPATLYPSA